MINIRCVIRWSLPNIDLNLNDIQFFLVIVEIILERKERKKERKKEEGRRRRVGRGQDPFSRLVISSSLMSSFFSLFLFPIYLNNHNNNQLQQQQTQVYLGINWDHNTNLLKGLCPSVGKGLGGSSGA